MRSDRMIGFVARWAARRSRDRLDGGVPVGRVGLRDAALAGAALAGAALAGAALAGAATIAPLHAQTKFWTSSPYRVGVELAVDRAAERAGAAAEGLAQSLGRRAETALSPYWDWTLQIARDDRLAACGRLEEVAWDQLPDPLHHLDKVLQLHVGADATGFVIRCREFDAYVRRWGMIQRRTVAQREFLAEACFQLLLATFAPLAEIVPDEERPDRVLLLLKGRDLQPRESFIGLARGTVLLPLSRRTARSGDLRPDGVSIVPWTYLEATEPEEDAWAAAVHSGIRRPFGVRRRGQVQQLALVLRAGSPTTTVRFHARNDPAAALVGYEAFVKTGEQTTAWVGVTDSHGELVLPRGHDPIATLLLRSDGLLLAKVPVPVGALTRIEAPIADDGARLRAQAELRAIREELIDLVAQRAILMARVRAQLAAGKIDAAARLMEELNELPLQSTFDRRIETAARAAHSDDPLVQGRIDKLFGDTRALLSKFLNVRQITDLQNEVLRAQSAATAPPAEDPPPPKTPEPR